MAKKVPPEHRQRVRPPEGARRKAKRKPLVSVGDRFGELTVGKFLWAHPTRGHAWLMRCDCGRLAIRYTGQLLRCQRKDFIPCCLTCLQELRRGKYAHLRDQQHEDNRQYFLLLWEATGSLYSGVWEAKLRAAVRDELGLPDPEWQPPESGLETFGPEWDPDRYAGASRTENHYVDLPEMTLTEIGEEFGLNKERIRQIEAKALRKLRHPSRATLLDPFMTDQMTSRELARARALAVERAHQRIESEEAETWLKRLRWLQALQFKPQELTGSREGKKLPVMLRWRIEDKWRAPERAFARAIGPAGSGIVVQIGQRAVTLHKCGKKRYVGTAEAETSKLVELEVTLQL